MKRSIILSTLFLSACSVSGSEFIPSTPAEKAAFNAAQIIFTNSVCMPYFGSYGVSLGDMQRGADKYRAKAKRLGTTDDTLNAASRKAASGWDMYSAMVGEAEACKGSIQNANILASKA